MIKTNENRIIYLLKTYISDKFDIYYNNVDKLVDIDIFVKGCIILDKVKVNFRVHRFNVDEIKSYLPLNFYEITELGVNFTKEYNKAVDDCKYYAEILSDAFEGVYI